MKKRRMILAGLALTMLFVSLMASVAGGDTRTGLDVSAMRQLPDEGGALINEAMRRSPTLMQGIAALRAGALADSIGALGEAALETGNTGAVARYFYAEALARLGKSANALYYYNEFLSRWPGHPLADDVLLGVALVYLEAGRPADAGHWLRRIITDCPQGDRVPLARLILGGGGAAGVREPAQRSGVNSVQSADTLQERERGLQDRGRALDERESRIEARERLLADAEKKLEIDRQRVLDTENTLLARKQQLDTREKALDTRAAALDKREKELKDFENR